MTTKHDIEKMRAIFARKDQEGLTYEDLCRETGIPVSTLGYWARKLRGRAAAEPVFQEIAVVAAAPLVGEIEVIGPRGHRVLVSRTFDAEVLRRVLSALPC
jgi:transposase-like protein